MNQTDLPLRGLGIPIALALGLLGAIVLGFQIGSGELDLLLLITAAILLTAHIIYFSRFTWQIALLLCYSGFTYRPVGFEFSGLELTCGLGALLAGITFWQKRPSQRTGVLEHRSFNLLRFFLLLWIVYVVIHLFYNASSPYRPADFALKNALKSYFAPLAPAVLLWYFSGSPTAIRVHGNLVRIVALLMLVGLALNLLVATYSLLFNPYMLDPEAIGSGYLIPFINARPNPYTLRGIAPSAVLLGAIGLSLGPRKAGISRFLSLALIFLGFCGAAMSGGRATLLAAVLCVGTTLLLRRQIFALCLILILSGFFALVVNLSSGWIHHELPLVMARPLQLVMLEKEREAYATIESSTQWRWELFQMALTEWRSNRRIFWFGRATYGYGVNDYVAQEIRGGFEAKKVTSLRRGATHNLLTDLLVAFGLVGCILYYALVIAIIRFFWMIYRTRDLPPGVLALSLMGFVASATYLAIATVGGGFFSVEMIWILIVIIATLYRHRPKEVTDRRAAILTAPALKPRRFGTAARR